MFSPLSLIVDTAEPCCVWKLCISAKKPDSPIPVEIGLFNCRRAIVALSERARGHNPKLVVVPRNARHGCIDDHHLEAEFLFSDFAEALAAVNRLGAIAEAEWHHPDLLVAWGKVGVKLWTHKIDGLAEADFVLAAKFDRAMA